MITVISILAVFLIACIFVIFNMLKKIETLETYIEELEISNTSFDNFYTELKQRVGDMYSYVKNIDRLGSFESDDETGTIFKEIKAIIEMLNKGI